MQPVRTAGPLGSPQGAELGTKAEASRRLAREFAAGRTSIRHTLTDAGGRETTRIQSVDWLLPLQSL